MMQSKLYQGTKGKLRDKLVAFVFSVGVGWLFVYGIIWYLRKEREEDKDLILTNPVESKGKIVGLTSYKGLGATIEYLVNGQKFRIKPAVSNEFFDKKNIGDSVEVVYFKEKPERAMLKYKLWPK